ncbi:Haloacid Dehalogenase Superfamily Class (subfamily) IIA [Halomicrobium zhouii]|uniref:Haloacid Dehalogenase Superfamily Class (Subfamily) IIA n=1 Tax=Halomicrobium zhouii TaxID=767519 RepID=A0A1I6LS78_9EURY|nr:HAD-IIA family hydrolase [Halomicrobium zhouii]SFS06288.1 Haloacid Dehalogenase Superfamily Class (subfamily) IIA [Halomicrobium zhouii]
MLRGAIVDLDGTVYTGETLVDGADDGVDDLRAAGVTPLFFSNNPTRTGDAFVERLVEMGVDARPGDACSAADVTAAYLREEHAGASVYLVGSDSLADVLRDEGVTLTGDPAGADVVLASWTEAFAYEHLQDALDGLDEETAFLATDPDRTYPVDSGQFVPGTGAISGAMAAAAGREPDRVLGKPSPTALDYALERIGAPAEACLVVGDRLNTELAMGDRAGMTTALVLTGVCDRSDVETAAVEPDYVLDSLAAIRTVLDDLPD